MRQDDKAGVAGDVAEAVARLLVDLQPMNLSVRVTFRAAPVNPTRATGWPPKVSTWRRFTPTKWDRPR